MLKNTIAFLIMMRVSAIEEQQIVSRLMDYLDKSKEEIVWERSGSKDGRVYLREELDGKRDTDFTQSRYSAWLMEEKIHLEYIINQGDDSCFSMEFTRWAKMGLKPQPEDIVLFYNDPDLKEESGVQPPCFQARYQTISGVECEAEKVALRDFVDNGQRLIEYFKNMQDESVRRYLGLVQKFKHFKDSEEIIY